MATLRKIKKGNYTVIDNSVFMNYELSYKAKGLLCQMLSLPDGWTFSVEGLATMTSDGITLVRNALNELEAHGYLKRNQIRNPDGKMAGIEYVVSEYPISAKPISENPISVKPTLLNTNKLNTNLHTHIEQRPTIEEIRSYISEKKLNVDAEKFYEYFDAGDWLDSKGKPVRNWKQKLITWSNKNGNDFGAGGGVRGRIRTDDGRSKAGDEQVETGFIPNA